MNNPLINFDKGNHTALRHLRDSLSWSQVEMGRYLFPDTLNGADSKKAENRVKNDLRLQRKISRLEFRAHKSGELYTAGELWDSLKEETKKLICELLEAKNSGEDFALKRRALVADSSVYVSDSDYFLEHGSFCKRVFEENAELNIWFVHPTMLPVLEDVEVRTKWLEMLNKGVQIKFVWFSDLLEFGSVDYPVYSKFLDVCSNMTQVLDESTSGKISFYLVGLERQKGNSIIDSDLKGVDSVSIEVPVNRLLSLSRLRGFVFNKVKGSSKLTSYVASYNWDVLLYRQTEKDKNIMSDSGWVYHSSETENLFNAEIDYVNYKTRNKIQ